MLIINLLFDNKKKFGKSKDPTEPVHIEKVSTNNDLIITEEHTNKHMLEREGHPVAKLAATLDKAKLKFIAFYCTHPPGFWRFFRKKYKYLK